MVLDIRECPSKRVIVALALETVHHEPEAHPAVNHAEPGQ